MIVEARRMVDDDDNLIINLNLYVVNDEYSV
jgi:hypothetical protein